MGMLTHQNVISSFRQKLENSTSMLDLLNKTPQDFHNTIEVIKKQFNASVMALQSETDKIVQKINNSKDTAFLHSVAALIAKYKIELLTSYEFNKLQQDHKRQLFDALFGTDSKYAHLYSQYYDKDGVLEKNIISVINKQTNELCETNDSFSTLLEQNEQHAINVVLGTQKFDELDNQKVQLLCNMCSVFNYGKENNKGVISMSNVQMNENTQKAMCLLALRSDPRDLGMLAALGETTGLQFTSLKNSDSIFPSKSAMGNTMLRAVTAATFIAASAVILFAAAYFAAGASLLVGIGITIGTITAEALLFKAKDSIMNVHEENTINTATAVAASNNNHNTSFAKAFATAEMQQMVDYIMAPIRAEKDEQRFAALHNKDSEINKLEERVFLLCSKIKKVSNKIVCNNQSVAQKTQSNKLISHGMQALKKHGIQSTKQQGISIS